MQREQNIQHRRLSSWALIICSVLVVLGNGFLGSLFPAVIPVLVLAAIGGGLSLLALFLAARGRRLIPLALITPGAIILGYLFLSPVPFDPAMGSKLPKNPAGTGVFLENNALADAILLEPGVGPECVAIDDQGRLHTGLDDGRIVRLTESGEVEELVNTGGRPVGMQFSKEGDLIIADAWKGLISLARDGTLTTLTTAVDGKPMLFPDDLAIGADGKIYFSDASQHFRYGEEVLEIFEHRPSGRLLVYDPATKTTTTLLENLYFANGVALAADESFVLVAETFECRVMRYWLQGPKKGTADVFIDNLPGFPDNVTEAPDGGFWLALPGPRNDLLDTLREQPFRRTILWRFSRLANPPQVKHSYAVKLSASGSPTRSLEDSTGHIFSLTSVLEHDSKLYLGSHQNDKIGILDVD